MQQRECNKIRQKAFLQISRAWKGPSSAAKELSGIRITRLVCVTIGKPLALINDGGGSTESDATLFVHTSRTYCFCLNCWIIYTCVFLTVHSWDSSRVLRKRRHQGMYAETPASTVQQFMSVMRPSLLPLFDAYYLRGVSVVISSDPQTIPRW